MRRPDTPTRVAEEGPVYFRNQGTVVLGLFSGSPEQEGGPRVGAVSLPGARLQEAEQPLELSAWGPQELLGALLNLVVVVVGGVPELSFLELTTALEGPLKAVRLGEDLSVVNSPLMVDAQWPFASQLPSPGCHP